MKKLSSNISHLKALDVKRLLRRRPVIAFIGALIFTLLHLGIPQGVQGEMANSRTASAVATASLGNRIYAFARGLDNRIYHTSAADGQPFGAWAEMPGGGTTDVAPSAASLGNRIYVFAKGIDDKRIYHTSAADGQPFGQWSLMR